jgi:C4-dicarboxylate-specific signal transduction histidine kinase
VISSGYVARYLRSASFVPSVLNWPSKALAEARENTIRALVIRLSFTAVCISAALLVTLILQEIGTGRPTLFPFFVAIAASAWFGGPSTGVVAVLLSLPFGFYFYSVDLGVFGPRLENFLILLLFALCAAGGGRLGAMRRQADNTIAAKAHQLLLANEALREEISERRRAEQALQEAQAELARAARLTTMGELAATIAHEINQPLAAISNSAGACIRWLNANPPNLNEARLSAGWIARDSARAAAVISRVRAMVRNNMPEKSSISVNHVIEDVLSSIGYELRKNHVAVKLLLDPSAPRLLADRVQLQQVFLNIFINAMEAMEQVKHRSLSISTAAREGQIRVTIEDSGGGIAGGAEEIFQPFYTTKPSGMGLGLAICRSIVEGYGGELKAVAGARGACFRLVMPKQE